MKLLWLLLFSVLSVQAQTERVVIIQMNPTQSVPARNSWQSQYDGQKVEYQLVKDHPLRNLSGYLTHEKPVFSSSCLDPLYDNCFQPEMKVVFADWTYVFGNHTATVLKFRNSAPYTPSGKLMAQDFMFTETNLKAVNQLRDELFATSYASYFEQKGTPALVSHSAAYQQHLLASAKANREPVALDSADDDLDFDIDSFDEDMFGDIDINIDETPKPEIDEAYNTKLTKDDKAAIKELETTTLDLDDGLSIDDMLMDDLDMDDMGEEEFGDFEDDDLFGDLDLDFDF